MDKNTVVNNNITPHPGHPDAIEKGCTCNPNLNNHGIGVNLNHEIYFYISSSCPVHGIASNYKPLEHWIILKDLKKLKL